MKTACLFIVYFFSFSSLFAQEKGVTPINNQQSATNNQQTYAVVVGISDYQDEGIPDLQYAHRDAEAFAQYLHSPSCNVPANNIRLLLNEQATNGKLNAAMDWLLTETQPGDRVIFYFSGHGDMNAKVLNQLGFLLLWDSPASVYLAGALSVNMLQTFITTLSVENQVNVWVIADACRAGKLAQSEIIGPQLTNSKLARQWSNEIKILSCQPNEFSIEGAQWGGGRGVFSYHLINGLIGKADNDGDKFISLLEIDRYLAEHVSSEVAPLRQIPMTVGDKKTFIAQVDQKLVDQAEQNQEYRLPAFEPVAQRGLVNEVLAEADSSILQLYTAYENAITENRLIEPADNCADYYYSKLVKIDLIKTLHPALRRNFAAALIDRAQQFINLTLKTDKRHIDEMWGGKINYHHIAKKVQRATELLGEKHPVYPQLKAKEYFFKSAYNPSSDLYAGIQSYDSIRSVQKQILDKALTYDSNAVYIMGSQLFLLLHLDSLDHYAEKIAALTPKWAKGLTDVASFYRGRDNDFSIEYYQKAIEADSTYLHSYFWITHTYAALGMVTEETKFRKQFIEKMEQKFQNKEKVHGYELNNLANAYWTERRYKDAEKALLEMEKILDGKNWATYTYLRSIYMDLGKWEEAIEADNKLRSLRGRRFGLTETGVIYQYGLRDLIKAEEIFLECGVYGKYSLYFLYTKAGEIEKAITHMDSLVQVYPEYAHYGFWSAEGHRQLGDTLLAKDLYQKICLSLDSLDYSYNRPSPHWLTKMIALHRLDRHEELEAIKQEAYKTEANKEWFHFYLACFYAMVGEQKNAFEQLNIAEKLGWHPKSIVYIWGTVYNHFLDPIRDLPAFQEWELRWSPPYKDYSKE